MDRKRRHNVRLLEPEMIADYECITGEGPLWHPDEQRLYWLDIPTGRMFRYTPSTDHHEQFYDGDVVGGFTIQEDGSLLLFGTGGSVRLWRNGHVKTLIEQIPEEKGGRFNDVIADPVGRVFCGTMPTDERSGRLYRLDTDGALHIVLEDAGLSNGMGFSPDGGLFYHTNSQARTITRFEYDRKSGEIGQPHVIVKVPEGEGVPDGLTVDAEGNLWSARWNGGCLVRFKSDGEEEFRVSFPTRKVSSATFGGDDYGDLYVTTAGGDAKETEGWGAGALFRLRPGVQGRPGFRSRVRV